MAGLCCQLNACLFVNISAPFPPVLAVVYCCGVARFVVFALLVFFAFLVLVALRLVLFMPPLSIFGNADVWPASPLGRSVLGGVWAYDIPAAAIISAALVATAYNFLIALPPRISCNATSAPPLKGSATASLEQDLVMNGYSSDRGRDVRVELARLGLDLEADQAPLSTVGVKARQPP
jgi:hypothetical protein